MFPLSTSTDPRDMTAKSDKIARSSSRSLLPDPVCKVVLVPHMILHRVTLTESENSVIQASILEPTAKHAKAEQRPPRNHIFVLDK